MTRFDVGVVQAAGLAIGAKIARSGVFPRYYSLLKGISMITGWTYVFGSKLDKFYIYFGYHDSHRLYQINGVESKQSYRDSKI